MAAAFGFYSNPVAYEVCLGLLGVVCVGRTVRHLSAWATRQGSVQTWAQPCFSKTLPGSAALAPRPQGRRAHTGRPPFPVTLQTAKGRVEASRTPGLGQLIQLQVPDGETVWANLRADDFPPLLCNQEAPGFQRVSYGQ